MGGAESPGPGGIVTSEIGEYLITTANGLRRSLLLATSFAAISATAPAVAQEVDEDQFRVAPERASVVNTSMTATGFDMNAQAGDLQIEDYRVVVPGIVDPNLPPPDGVLDITGVNGVGMMYRDPGFVCSGSLVNPRMVIFAAHCVNDVPEEEYGADTGGTAIAFSFGDNALPGFRAWFNNGLNTDESLAVYDVENVWYDARSLEGDNIGFLEADIAIATLDTPAFDVPKWALLFTALDQQEHAVVTGYGRSGNGSTGDQQGIDWRRRAGENYVSWLGSIDDRNRFLFGQPFGDNPSSLYWTAFTCREPNNDIGCEFDFKIFGENDVALPLESTTAGGDSGGPLIIDQKWEIPVIAGVLSGGSRFFGPQVFSSFGTVSFYQPLFEYWQLIVENNPYVFATAFEGDFNWDDSSAWVQQLDPAYQVEVNGELVNGVPSTLGTETAGGAAGFGDVCFFEDCQEFDYEAVIVADGVNYADVPNGPGTTNFVPDNQISDPRNNVKPRYYEVTLSEAGTITLSSEKTIDWFNLEGQATLAVSESGTLNVLGDYFQRGGQTDINGLVSAGEVFFGAGVVTGRGTFQADFTTVGAAFVSPGDANVFTRSKNRIFGELTFDGDLILTSGSVLAIDLGRSDNDLLTVTGTAQLSNGESEGGALFLRTSGNSVAPRDGQQFTILTAGNGVEGEFGSTVSLFGNLNSNVTYNDNDIVISLEAGRFSEYSLTGAKGLSKGKRDIVASFAQGLDDLRDAGHYDSLYNLFGHVDVMDPYTLASTLSSFAPSFNSEASGLRERQSRVLFNGVTDRLSVMGGAAGGSLSITGAPRAAIGGSYESAAVSTRLGVAGLAPTSEAQMALPEGVTGFVTGGVISSANSFGVNDTAADGQRSSYFGMGIEHEMAKNLTMGVAFGRASGRSNIGGDFADSELNQVAGYASYDLGGGAYLGAVGTMENAELETTRSGFDGTNGYQLLGASKVSKMTAMAEAGVNVGISSGLTLTPRAQMAWSRTHLDGFDEIGGETALQIDDLKTEQLQARFGAKLAGQQGVAGKWAIVPQVQADYVRVVGGSNDGMTVRFAGASDVPIALPFAGGDTSWGEVRGGVKLTNGTVQFGASFETAIGREDFRDDRAMADLTVRF
ncbi:autotransporter domain-containing protein [Altererythrobacter sp. MTPC7]|uniref:autotransporter domain-containing protein n=1 Tax=Altererythrobacter sp. MTPC7 TaxID=3056567 RepID=UPI0036F3954D